MILTAIGGVSVLVGALGWLLKRWVESAERARERADEQRHTQLLQSLQLQHENTLASLASLQNERHDLFTAAVTSASTTNLAAQNSRVEAIKAFWSQYLRIKQRTYHLLTGLQLNFAYRAEASEWERTADSFEHPLQDLGGYLGLSRWLDQLHQEMETLRPIIGERLWQLSWAYYLLLARASLHASKEVLKHQVPAVAQPWYEPEDETKSFLNLIVRVLPEVHQPWVRNQKDRGFRVMLDLLEARILDEAQLVLSGAAATRAHIEESRKLADALTRALAESPSGASLPALTGQR